VGGGRLIPVADAAGQQADAAGAHEATAPSSGWRAGARPWGAAPCRRWRCTATNAPPGCSAHARGEGLAGECSSPRQEITGGR
jgi:hypothetical protein